MKTLLPFLIDLAVGLIAIPVITLTVLGANWLYDFIKKKQEERERHKPTIHDTIHIVPDDWKNSTNDPIIIVDTHTTVDEHLKNKPETENKGEISMEELERWCDENPYVVASTDNKTGEYKCEAIIKPEKIERSLKEKFVEEKGILIFE